jgi:hypothetical protein
MCLVFGVCSGAAGISDEFNHKDHEEHKKFTSVKPRRNFVTFVPFVVKNQ